MLFGRRNAGATRPCHLIQSTRLPVASEAQTIFAFYRPLATHPGQRPSIKKETFRRGEEGFFGVSGPVIFGARAQNGKVTLKLTSSMPNGYLHAFGDRSKDELLLLGGLLSRLLCGFLSGFFGCHGTSPPFLFRKCKGVEKQSQRFFCDSRDFFHRHRSRIVHSSPARSGGNLAEKTVILRAASHRRASRDDLFSRTREMKKNFRADDFYSRQPFAHRRFCIPCDAWTRAYHAARPTFHERISWLTSPKLPWF